ncbi:hypothetical protein ACSSV8_003388, partial [Roseovarius sp. MBR-79]
MTNAKKTSCDSLVLLVNTPSPAALRRCLVVLGIEARMC